MMKTPEALLRDYATRAYGAASIIGCSLPQSKVRAVFMVIANIIREQTPQMRLVQGDNPVQKFVPTAFDPTLRNPVLPWTPKGGSHGIQLEGPYGGRDFRAVFCIAVKDQIPGRRPKWKGFPQLLDNPGGRGMGSNVEMQDPPTIMIDDDEAVEHAERKRGNGEEIHRRDGFPMVVKKGKPAPGRIRSPGGSFHPPRDCSLGNIESEHEEFSVNTRRTPSGVLGNHAGDQFPNLYGGGSSSNPPSGVGDQPPVQAETGTVPPDNRLGCHDNKRLFPSRPETTSDNPKQPVEADEARPWTSPFQYDKLLTQGEIFEEKSSTGTKETKEYSQT